MELNDEELKDFRDRALQAATYGHEIGVAELYEEALAAEVGHSDVPAGASPRSAAHLLALATEALELRANGGKKAKRHKKSDEPKPEPKAKVESEVKAEEPKPEPKEGPKPEAKDEPKVEEKVAEEVKPEEPKAEKPKAEEKPVETHSKSEAKADDDKGHKGHKATTHHKR